MALATVFPLQRAFAYDIDQQVQRRFVAEMSSELGIEIIGVASPKEAVVESDLVVTSGPILRHPRPAIDKGWLRKGAFASAVDFDSYWSTGALEEFDKIATDDHAQFQYYKAHGYFSTTPAPYASLDEIIGRLKPGRERDDERCLAINLGLALDDMAVAPEIYRRAKDRGIGTWVPL